MTSVDAQEIEPGLQPNYLLAVNRELLAGVLSTPSITDPWYESAVCDYIDSLTAYHFPENGKPQFATYNEIAKMIKTEVFFLTGEHRFCVIDIEQDILRYSKDEAGQFLQAEGYNSLPRAIVLTMLDRIDETRD